MRKSILFHTQFLEASRFLYTFPYKIKIFYIPSLTQKLLIKKNIILPTKTWESQPLPRFGGKNIPNLPAVLQHQLILFHSRSSHKRKLDRNLSQFLVQKMCKADGGITKDVPQKSPISTIFSNHLTTMNRENLEDDWGRMLRGRRWIHQSPWIYLVLHHQEDWDRKNEIVFNLCLQFTKYRSNTITISLFQIPLTIRDYKKHVETEHIL